MRIKAALLTGVFLTGFISPAMAAPIYTFPVADLASLTIYLVGLVTPMLFLLLSGDELFI